MCIEEEDHIKDKCWYEERSLLPSLPPYLPPSLPTSDTTSSSISSALLRLPGFRPFPFAISRNASRVMEAYSGEEGGEGGREEEGEEEGEEEEGACDGSRKGGWCGVRK